MKNTLIITGSLLTGIGIDSYVGLDYWSISPNLSFPIGLIIIGIALIIVGFIFGKKPLSYKDDIIEEQRKKIIGLKQIHKVISDSFTSIINRQGEELEAFAEKVVELRHDKKLNQNMKYYYRDQADKYREQIKTAEGN